MQRGVCVCGGLVWACSTGHRARAASRALNIPRSPHPPIPVHAIHMCFSCRHVASCLCVLPFAHHTTTPPQEIVGLGLANFAGSAFNAYSTTGSFSRSAVNYDSGVGPMLAAALLIWWCVGLGSGIGEGVLQGLFVASCAIEPYTHGAAADTLCI